MYVTARLLRPGGLVRQRELWQLEEGQLPSSRRWGLILSVNFTGPRGAHIFGQTLF